MPSLKKALHFLSSAMCCAGGVALLGYGMSVEWSTTFVDCSSSNSSGSGILTLGLFDGNIQLETCPFFDSTKDLNVLTDMKGEALGLHCTVLALLVLALIGSAGSILITLYNSISNPYETYMGPVGLYACAGGSLGFSFLAIIVYVSYVHLLDFAVKWIGDFAITGKLSDPKVTMGLGYFLVLPYMAVNVLAIVLVYLYVHAAYTEKKAQQKPTEDNQDGLIMY